MTKTEAIERVRHLLALANSENEHEAANAAAVAATIMLADVGLHRTQQIGFIGRPSDAACAAYMLDAIANDVDQLAARHVAKAGRRARAAGKAFRLGCAHTIAHRLAAVTQQTDDTIRGELTAAGDSTALARLDTAIARRETDAKRLDAFLASNGIEYGSARAVTVSSRDSYDAGKRAGESVRLAGGSAALGTGARALPAGRGSR